MNSRYLPLCPVLLFFSFQSIAQQPAFNQNSSRSNHTRAYNQNAARSNTARLMNSSNDWQFGVNAGASFGMNSNEASLFRGNGTMAGLSAQYFFGALGLGLNSGFINTQFNTSAINQFLIDRRFPQSSTINTSPAQNAFLLLGPSFRIGQKVQFIAGAKAGIFFNQSGGLTIGQQGAVRPLYRFDGGTKNIFPGFNGSLAFSYPVSQTSSIQLTADFLRSSASIQLFDPTQGIDIPVQQNRNFQTISTGISFIKTFSIRAKSDLGAAGMQTNPYAANGPSENTRKTRGGVKQKAWTLSNYRTTAQNDDKNSNEEVSIIDPENKRKQKQWLPANFRTANANDQSTTQSCGPVTLKTTKPDGTVEEQTFSCPDDALQYQQKSGGMPNRISMNVTTPKQTQGATFGEKVNQGLQSTGSHIVAGRIIRSTNENTIVTNRNHIGGAASASYAATGLIVQPGVQTHLYAKETGSGMATGRGQYQPLFFDGLPQEDVCNPCLGRVKNNPLYKGKGPRTNPLSSNRTTGKEECDDTDLVFDVQLIDRNTGAIVATTKTNACGEYWFANVPDGNYNVTVAANIAMKKSYDFYSALSSRQKTDIAGEVMVPNETWQHIIYGAGSGKVSVQDLSIVVADTDGDDQAEFFRAQGTFTDGSTQDFTQSSTAKSGGTGKVSMQDFHFTLPASNQRSGGKVNVQDIHFTKRTGTLTATATFSDGTTQDVTAMIEMKQSGAVQQFSVHTGDVDGDGAPDLIWSPRSNIGVSAQSAKVNVQDISFTKRTNQYIQNLPVLIGDVDGDGVPELIVGKGAGLLGSAVPGMGVITARTFENGDIPNQDDFSMARPGGPVRGTLIKIGKDPGGDVVAQGRTNSFGEFEFLNLEPGNYRIIVEASYLINDVTDIDLNDEGTGIYSKSGYVKLTASQNGQSLSTNSNTDGTNSNTKAQDYNSSRSNKTASIASFNDLLEVLNELDQQLQTDNTPQTKAGVSTSRSNVRNLNAMVESIINDIENDNISAAKQKMNSLNVQLLALHQSLQKMGDRYSSISNVLKTKHDTAKNSIGNIR